MGTLTDSIASFNPIERALGIMHSVRLERGLRHSRRRIRGVRRIEWPRACGLAPADIEQTLLSAGIRISNRGFTGDEETGDIWCDVAAGQYYWAQRIVAGLIGAKPAVHLWREGGRQRPGPTLTPPTSSKTA